MTNYDNAGLDPLDVLRKLVGRVTALEQSATEQSIATQQVSTGVRLEALAYSFDSDGSFNQEKADAVANWLAGASKETVTNG